ncbi:alpha-L-rhamnosidase [Bifidobacterium vansinderenii]|nr:alpha-L-rhamnosidase [Bifidobacterium vansinderenii]
MMTNATQTVEQSISRLRVEHAHGDVIGLPTGTPRLSWDYAVEPPSDSEIVFHVERRTLGAAEPVVQEARVPAADNTLCAWPLPALASFESAVATVQLVDANGEPVSPTSSPVRFEAALLENFQHFADFVGPSWVEPETDHRHLPLVRAEINLRDKPAAARLTLTALGVVEAEINGVKIADDALLPGWTVYSDRLDCWTFDITDRLVSGANALGFWLGDGWWRGRLGFDGGWVNFYGDRIGVAAQIDLVYPDGGTERILSNSWDRTWKVTPGPIVCSDLYEGEHYDARLEQPGWSMPGFDDSSWKPVAEVHYDTTKLVNAELPPVRPIERDEPVSIVKRDDGSWLIDFGQNCSQRMRVHMRGLASGDTVTMRHVEVLNPDGSLATRTLRRGQQCDVYTSNGTDAWWEPRFAMHGFRYASIEGYKGELTADDIDCRVYHTDMERTGWFDCSNPMVNQLHSNAVWSMRSNFVSIPMDCPQRDERMGWTGDISLFSPTATYLYDAQSFLANWLEDVRGEQLRYGTVPFYVPFIPIGAWGTAAAIAIWGDSAAIVPWALYMDGGDTELLRRSYPLMTTWIDEVAGYLSEDGVWERRPEFAIGQLGDWLDPTAPPDDPMLAMTDKVLVATAFFAQSCRIAADVARVLGEPEDTLRFGRLYDHVRGGFIGRYVGENGIMTSDTQCAYALAIALGLLDDDDALRAAAGDRLAQLVRESGGKVATGFAGTPYVLPALSRTGHDEEAYSLLLSTECPSWLYQVKMGATTTWERWDSMMPDGTVNPGGMTSFNHYALGSVAHWLHARIGGLEPIEPGWRRFRVAPMPGGGIDHASTSHMTPYGLAACSWSVADGAGADATVTDSDAANAGRVMTVEVDVPVGTVASLEIGPAPQELAPGHHTLTIRL